VELAKDWRMDKALRRLEAMLLVGNTEKMLMISGQGDVMEPDSQVMAIGSGASVAIAAAKAMLRHTNLNAEEIANEAMKIAAEQCIYTNDQITVETLP
jgi:ATP-dependent HslUV protease subunit HslV